jgi:hypothetical protein
MHPVVKRPTAQVVARGKQLSFALIPDGECKIPHQMLYTSTPPAAIGRQYQLFNRQRVCGRSLAERGGQIQPVVQTRVCCNQQFACVIPRW